MTAMSKPSERPFAVVIDDNEDIRGMLEEVLVQAGFEVVLTESAADGVEAVAEFEPTLTLLDINMPGMDGFTAAARIRTFSSTYLVLVSGLSEEIDVVQGFAAGADDYVFKPFRVRELRARFEALMRRPRVWVADPTVLSGTAQPTEAPQPGEVLPEPIAPMPQVWRPTASPDAGGAAPVQEAPNGWAQVAPAPAAPLNTGSTSPAINPSGGVRDGEQSPPSEWLTHHGLALHRGRREVVVDGGSVPLTDTEFNLLATLMEHGRRVRSTSSLTLAMRGESHVTAHYITASDRSAVNEHMRNLKRKLGESDTSPRWIETVRGVGFRMTTP